MMTVRREAGEEEVAPVHYDEGIANHIGPEPCVVGREAGGEASAGVPVGQPLPPTKGSGRRLSVG